jgi:hypothetical protein
MGGTREVIGRATRAPAENMAVCHGCGSSPANITPVGRIIGAGRADNVGLN